MRGAPRTFLNFSVLCARVNAAVRLLLDCYLMRNKFYSFSLLLLLVFALWSADFVFSQSSSAPLIKSESTAAKNLKAFDVLWGKVNEHYFDPKFNGVNWAKIKEIYRPQAEKAENKDALLLLFKRMLGELKTSHLDVWLYVKEKDLERQIGENVDLKRDFIKIGAGFDTNTVAGRQIVSRVYDSTPAKTAGVQAGWTLLSVNDIVASRRSLSELFEFYEGQKLNYSFLNDENKEIILTLPNVFFVSKSARIARRLEGSTGYIKFDGFTSGVGDWLQQQIADFKQLKLIIIDLRGNGGGAVEECRKTLSLFFAEDMEFGTFIERRGKFKELKIKGSGNKAFNGKVIVLIDEDSGSASEIFSIIMQENKRAQIVGMRTRGAVLNSRDFELPENFGLRVAFRDYLSPKGVRLENIGVKPNIEIELTIEDIRTKRDGVLEQAIKINE